MSQPSVFAGRSKPATPFYLARSPPKFPSSGLPKTDIVTNGIYKVIITTYDEF
jgi:hypothetical protein